MENKDLFQKVPEGYSCDEVEQYINVLKAEYKKVFEYAKATEANNEKLKKICRALSDENKAFKANGAAATPAATNDASVLESVEKIAKLSEEIAKENAALRSKITK
ncbi:MAG: hypothetical protein IJB45_02445 [Clostridia bacterium]|nr:hypothetical protein [Clostridia bacterium]